MAISTAGIDKFGSHFFSNDLDLPDEKNKFTSVILGALGDIAHDDQILLRVIDWKTIQVYYLYQCHCL